MTQVQWTLSPDACSEVRRQVFRQRVDCGRMGQDLGRESLVIEHGIIIEFLREEFGDWVAHGFQSSVAPNDLPDVRSWHYPGEWATPLLEQLEGQFTGAGVSHVFSTSGSYTISARKADITM